MLVVASYGIRIVKRGSGGANVTLSELTIAILSRCQLIYQQAGVETRIYRVSLSDIVEVVAVS